MASSNMLCNRDWRRRPPSMYPTPRQIMCVHPEIRNLPRLRNRHFEEYIPSQQQLETEMQNGLRDLEVDTFYCYFEEEYNMNGSIVVVRYGSVFKGNHWVFTIAVFPKNHPDAEQVPYAMEDVSQLKN